MAQSARDARLETRTARLRLPGRTRHHRALGSGLTLIYRRTGEGYGTWSAKLAVRDGKYVLRALGAADDYQEANGADVLTFRQAQDAARKLADNVKVDAGIVVTPLTVAEAATRYLNWYREHRRAPRETEHVIRTHILPALGTIRLDALTSVKLRDWLNDVATAPARVRTAADASKHNYRPPPKTADEKRARRATANRILNVLKAILNRAFHDGLIGDDTAWRKVKPFPRVDEPRIRFLSDAEAVRLVSACPDQLRALVRAALLTGARYGELTSLRVQDVRLKTAQVYVGDSKSGRPRHIPLNSEGVALFRTQLAGKTAESFVFARDDGSPWGKNHHVRPLRAACEVAKIRPSVAFHELRHTYASHLAQAGVDLLTIAKLLGHADTRITAKHYAHLADKTLAAAVTKLPAFGVTRAGSVRSMA